MPHKLLDSIKLNADKIAEVTLVCGEKYMTPGQENSRWYLDTEVGSVYTTDSLKTLLVKCQSSYNYSAIT